VKERKKKRKMICMRSETPLSLHVHCQKALNAGAGKWTEPNTE